MHIPLRNVFQSITRARDNAFPLAGFLLLDATVAVERGQWLLMMDFLAFGDGLAIVVY